MHFPLRVVLGMLVVAVTVLGMPATAPAKVFSPETFTLANGLQVVVVTNKRAPIVSHMVWYKVGAADERPGKSGIAHFLEHLMFKGTGTVPPGQFSKIVARNGGNDNAFTTEDYTAYFQRVARDKLDLVMGLEADRMHNLVLTDAVVLPELQVVLEERRSRIDNDPGGQLYEESQAALYLNHPYRIPTIGWKHEIETLTTADALAFYRRYYAPNNAILVVVGDVSAAEVRPLAERYYGPIPRGPDIVRARPSEPPHHATRRVEMKSARVRQPSWSKTWLMPSYRTAKGNDAYALQVLAEVLGGGATARLYRGLVVEKGIAAAANAWYSPIQLDSGAFGVSATPRPGKDVAALEAAVLAEVNRMLTEGVTEDEVAHAKKSMMAAAIYARDSLRSASSALGRALATGQTVDDVENWPDRIGEVTAADVSRVARTFLIDTQSVTSVLLPREGS